MTHCFGIDIGNSGLRVATLDLAQASLGPMLRINWQPVSGAAIRLDHAGPPRYLPTDASWTMRLSEFLEQQVEMANSTPPHWWISSVRRDALQILLSFLQSLKGHQFTIVDYTQLPLSVAVESPARVGIDRLLAALAATELTTERPAVVVQAGSAVTVDLLTAAPTVTGDAAAHELQKLATFAGGAILPGVPMMLRLLGQAADLLPRVDADDLLELPALPGKNTEQAMICGAASALVGGVTHLIGRYRAMFGTDVPVILSGGDGLRLAQYISAPVSDRPHLVHYGLLKLATLAPQLRFAPPQSRFAPRN